ncbi:MAG: 50S ribosomal protein L1 [Cytophagales bacterium]|nr:50S ribosomal protein L1 [Cytophagales bacterium]
MPVRKTKKRTKILSLFDKNRKYKLEEAISTVKQCCLANFDESLDLSVELGVDAKKSEQVVRGVVVLPHGNGKKKKVLAICPSGEEEHCLTAGADYAGNEEYLKKLAEGWCDCDVIVTTPTMMRDFTRLGKVLGPKGLMPNPKTGGVTTDLVKTIKDIKGGRIEFRCDKDGYVHNSIGRKSFQDDKIVENIKALVAALVKAKPSSSKGTFLKSITLSSTMGCGVELDINSISR